MTQVFKACASSLFTVKRVGKFALMLGFLGVLTACGSSEPSRFYTLADLPGPSETSSSNNALAIGLGSVTFPGYLDRQQIVVRQSRHRLEAAEFDRWAEPLKQTIPRVLAENLSFLLGSDEIYFAPQRIPRPLDLVISVEFMHFEATARGDVILVARWEILNPNDEHRLKGGRAVVNRSGALPDDYESIVALLSDALGDFARILVEEIRDLPG